METFKRILAFLMAGAILGVVVASFIAAQYLPWYNAPSMGQALCNCEDATRQTVSAVYRNQLIGLAVGAVIGGVLGIVLGRTKGPPPALPTT